jgi:hypothetical protein
MILRFSPRRHLESLLRKFIDKTGSGAMSGTGRDLEFFSKIELWRSKSAQGKIA